MKGYARHVRTVLVVVLALNAAVAVGKLVVGWRAGSLAVVGDGLHSAVDALGSLVALLVLRLATAPADADHPYGHAKFETVSALALAGLMGLTAFELGQASVGRLLSPSTPTYGTLTLAVMGATLAVNVGVVWLEGREARRTGSALLAADARHTRGDVLVTVAILASVPLQRLGFARLDAGLALAVSVLIAHAAWTVLREALPVLTDRIVHDPAEVARIVREVPGVRSVHDIRSRGPRREAYVQMHLVVDATDVVAAHAIADEVERRLATELGVKESFVHIEPEDDASGPPGTNGERAGAA